MLPLWFSIAVALAEPPLGQGALHRVARSTSGMQRPGDNSSVQNLAGISVMQLSMVAAPLLLPVGANGRDLSPHAWMGSDLVSLDFFFFGCPPVLSGSGGLRGKGR